MGGESTPRSRARACGAGTSISVSVSSWQAGPTDSDMSAHALFFE